MAPIGAPTVASTLACMAYLRGSVFCQPSQLRWSFLVLFFFDIGRFVFFLCLLFSLQGILALSFSFTRLILPLVFAFSCGLLLWLPALAFSFGLKFCLTSVWLSILIFSFDFQLGCTRGLHLHLCLSSYRDFPFGFHFGFQLGLSGLHTWLASLSFVGLRHLFLISTACFEWTIANLYFLFLLFLDTLCSHYP